MPGVSYLEERDLVAQPLRAAPAPMCSLLMAVRDAAGAERSDTPEAWRRVLRAHLTNRDYRVLAPLATPRPTQVPSALLGFGAATLADAFEQLIAAEDELAREIHECLGPDSAGDWREPARDPRAWVRGVVLALARAWSGFRPIWEAGRQHLAGEFERVSAAGERQAHLALLDDLLPCGHVTGDRWVLDCTSPEDVRLEVSEAGLTLVPLVAGSRASIVDGEAGRVRLVGYPLRARRNRAPEATLEALVGIPRTQILRALDRPATNNRLAEALQTVPSAATHHVSALVAAGLVMRDRSGGRLLVRRTPRGDALLALYEPGW